MTLTRTLCYGKLRPQPFQRLTHFLALLTLPQHEGRPWERQPRLLLANLLLQSYRFPYFRAADVMFGAGVNENVFL